MSTLQLMRGLPPQGGGGGGAGGGGSPITRIPNVFVILADGSGDYANLTTALAAVPAAGAKYILGSGTFNLTAGIPNPAQSMITIEGQGPGQTIISSSAGDGSSILDFEGSTDANSLVLTANANIGQATAVMASSDAAQLTVGQYVLIRSNVIADPDFTGRKIGEIQKVASISGGTVTFVDNLADTYDTAHGASVRGLQMLHDITLRNLTIKSTAGANATMGQGQVFFRFVRGIRIENVECDSLWWAGIDVMSCIEWSIDAHVHDTQDPAGSTGSQHYGVSYRCASKSGVVRNSKIYHVRHGVTGGGSSGTNREGIPRAIVIDHNNIEATDEMGIDTHNSGQGIQISNNTIIGGLPTGTNTSAGGIQVRAADSVVKNNLIINPAGRGIYCLGTASGTHLIGNTIINCHAVSGGAAGDAIYLDPSITKILIDGNEINGADAHGVKGTGSNNDCEINNNEFFNCNASDGDIYMLDALNVSCSFNQHRDGANKGLVMDGVADKWRIIGNDYTNKPSPTPTLVGSNNVVFFNLGFSSGQALSLVTSPLTLSGFGSLTIQTNNATTKTEIDIVPNISTVASNRIGAQLKLYNSSDLTNFEFIEMVTQGTGNYLIDVEKGGSGSLRQLDFTMQGTTAFSILTGGTANAASPFSVGTNLSLSSTGLTAVRTFTFPDSSDTVVTLAATQTLTGKTLSAPTLSGTVAGTPTIASAWTWSAGQTFSTLTITSSPFTLSGFGSLTIQTNNASTKTQINIVPNIDAVSSTRIGGQLQIYNNSNATDNEFVQLVADGQGGYLLDVEKSGAGSLRALIVQMSGNSLLTFNTDHSMDFNSQTVKNTVLDSSNKLDTNTTGSGSAALGSNCPAVTASAPFTWAQLKSHDGSTVYVPVWK